MAGNKKPQPDEEEDIISISIGEYGKYQLILTFLLSLINIPCTWHIFAPTFHARERPTWCARPPQYINIDPQVWKNYTQPSGYCSIIDYHYINVTGNTINNILPGATEIKCDAWEFGEYGDTIISEFNLLCDRKQLNNVAEMVFLGGVALGGLAGGIISDRYGRKTTLMACLILQTTLGTLISFAPWFEMYVVLRAMLGFISVSVVFSGFVLAIELVGGVWRTVAGISYLFPVSISYVIISGLAYLIRDWRSLQLAVSLPGSIFLLYWWIMPESPRWLLAMGRTQEVMVILQKAAKINKRELPHNLDKQLLPCGDTQMESVGVMDLFKTAKIRKITLFSFVIWFCVYLVYYGLVLNVGNIGGDLYVNSILSGLVEVPAIAISIVFLLRMGRRWPLALTMKFAGLACLLTVPIPYIFNDVQWLTTTLTMTGKFLISSSNAVLPVFTAELFPTTIRNIGVGASNVSAGFSLMLVPYLWEMAMVHTCVPMAILGTCGVIGGICVLFLPETGNAPLQESVTKTKGDSVTIATIATSGSA